MRLKSDTLRDGNQELFPEPLSRPSADIVIVGAGVAGTTAAAILSQQGWRVLLLEARSTCPPVFKAEKVERDELSLLQNFGLLEPLLSHSSFVSEAFAAYEGRIFRRVGMEHIGITYADLVNTLRTNLPAAVETRTGRVNRLSRDGKTMRVHLAGGEELTARLVVVACGVTNSLLSSLGLRRRVIQKEQCIGLGFNLVAANSRPFPFQAVTYYPSDPSFRIDYLTLFTIRDAMRANLFVFRSGNDPWIREFHREPRRLLHRAFPKLPDVIGEYEVTGRIVSGRVDLYCTEGEMPDGVVLIGDALQNACPSTGLGFKKVFTDIAVLAECVPAWFRSPGMSASKLRTFYDHPRKRSMDRVALRRAFYHRNAATSPSLRWRLHRALVHLKWNLERMKNLTLDFTESRVRTFRKLDLDDTAKAAATRELEAVSWEKE